MTSFKSPFSKNISAPGRGEVHVILMPPAKPSFSTLNYTYPLKLIPSSPHVLSHRHDASEEARNKNDATHSNGGPPEAQHAAPRPDTKDSSRPDPIITESVPLLFILSYGGGLLPPDTIDLSIRLDPGTRLALATQGSTKIFPSRPFQSARTEADAGSSTNTTTDPTSIPPTADIQTSDVFANPLPLAHQTIRVELGAHSALCLTPDPSQPFAGSRYQQYQKFTLHPTASLLLLDWTTEGRRARGESWDALLWRGCNEVWRVEEQDGKQSEFVSYEAPPVSPAAAVSASGQNGSANSAPAHVPGSTKIRRPAYDGRRMLVRDQVILEAEYGEKASGMLSGTGMRALKTEGVGCFGTLICAGDLVLPLGEFFIQEFEALPRIGGKKWDDDEDEEGRTMPADDDNSEEARRRRREEERRAWRARRIKLETDGKVLWNAARVRGLIMVKFSARDAQGARHWLGQMLTFEGTVLREFGPGGLMSVR